jgi:hypothetical protein
MNTALVFATVVALLVCAAFADHHEKKEGEYHATQTTGNVLFKLFHL